MDKFDHAAAALASFAMRRPVTITMLFFSLLVMGLGASRYLPLEKFPGIDFPELFIQVPYQDATPAEIEKMITRPVEEALATMSGIKRLRSVSNENSAEINIRFDWDANIKAKSIEAREKIDAIRHLLPSDVERVMVYKFNLSDMPVFQLRLSSDRDISNSFDLLERNLKMPIERIKGVSRVELYGVQKKQISILLDPDRVAALHVDVDILTRTLRAANFSMTAGQFFDLEQKITVNPSGEYRSKEEIADLIVMRNVRLSDIAEVIYETPKAVEGRHLDRTHAIGLNIFRESGANLVDVSEAVMTEIENAKNSSSFNGINVFVMQDEATSVTQSLQDLINSGLVGGLLSIIVLYLFLRNLATTLVVVLSVPFAICITLACMYFMGYTLNILSLMGLMLAVGMLVDNAVVVTESIFQEREKSDDIVEATKKGVSLVSLAVIAGTATTVIVFLPNIVGVKAELTVFLEHVAVSICISLLASLLIAQTLIPLLTTKLKIKPKCAQQKPSKLKAIYEQVLRWTLAHQKATAAIAVAILLSTSIPMTLLQSDDDSNNNQDRIWLNYDIQGNYSLGEVEKSVAKMEAYLYANKEKFHIKQVYSYYTAGFAVSGITLEDDLPVKVADLKNEIKQTLPLFVRARPSFQWDQGSGGGVRLTLFGQSSENLLRLANQIVPVLDSIEGLTDVKTDVDGQDFELQLTVDREKAFRFGLSSSDVATIVGTALRGSNLRTFRGETDGEVSIRLMYDESLQTSVEKLRNLTIFRDENQNVTLDMVASMKVEPRLSQIQRTSRQTSLSIGGNLEADITVDEARERIELIMQNIELPAGYSWSLEGSFQRQDEDEAIMLTNMVLAIIMIYIVMAALFESLLLPTAVLTSLIFSFTGVFWAFLITGNAMTVMGMIGMLILMGIVVNNGIVLVDRINYLANRGMSVPDAIIEGCLTRVRPILMTVLTTVLGLLPLAVGDVNIGGDGPPYAPMAIAIIGGLLFSTITSLFLVPLAYLLLLKLRRATVEMISESKMMVSKLIKAA
ncbi:efflux RND transporter permease subunit [Brumicola pallidula]|uniref:Hydrophobic/amphiphilic exporter-1, HAE1 family n=1 Tax=Brumicola pallidula DSM 14239 = ACAM 615 TaxID=1121922 RepID=K6YXF2_9ALTE|nr:efflux RND transporter permease subunit [Glaciecola pallidula]GAC28666.1 hydrophobic/amphiphilic exporter-1, HAE1 family [Glaciecola pallidula DSM 14239 = ACAM 615]